jgi:hypothetical protein
LLKTESEISRLSRMSENGNHGTIAWTEFAPARSSSKRPMTHHSSRAAL